MCSKSNNEYEFYKWYLNHYFNVLNTLKFDNNEMSFKIEKLKLIYAYTRNESIKTDLIF